MYKLFISIAISISMLLGCATNNGPKYKWVKTFESNVAFEPAKAQCDYENHIQARADRRAELSNSSFAFALLGMVDPTVAACMRRFGYDTVQIDQSNVSNNSTSSTGYSIKEKERIEALSTEAAKGDASAEVNLAYSYLMGNGVIKNYEQAYRFYLRAAPRISQNKGMAANAQVNLGLMYQDGLGLKQSNVLAMMWYQISASNGEYEGLKRLTNLKSKTSKQDQIESEKLVKICIAKELRSCDAPVSIEWKICEVKNILGLNDSEAKQIEMKKPIFVFNKNFINNEPKFVMITEETKPFYIEVEAVTNSNLSSQSSFMEYKGKNGSAVIKTDFDKKTLSLRLKKDEGFYELNSICN